MACRDQDPTSRDKGYGDSLDHVQVGFLIDPDKDYPLERLFSEPIAELIRACVDGDQEAVPCNVKPGDDAEPGFNPQYIDVEAAGLLSSPNQVNVTRIRLVTGKEDDGSDEAIAYFISVERDYPLETFVSPPLFLMMLACRRDDHDDLQRLLTINVAGTQALDPDLRRVKAAVWNSIGPECVNHVHVTLLGVLMTVATAFESKRCAELILSYDDASLSGHLPVFGNQCGDCEDKVCASRCTIHFTSDYDIDQLIKTVENGGNVAEETNAAGEKMAADELSDSQESPLNKRWHACRHLAEPTVSLLHIAAVNNNPLMCTMLIGRGVDVDVCDSEFDEAPVHVASYGGHDSLRVLLENGANIDLPDKAGNTPLHLASRLGNYDGVRLLLEKGANVQVKNKDGQTSLDRACDSESHEESTIFCVEALLHHCITNLGTEKALEMARSSRKGSRHGSTRTLETFITFHELLMDGSEDPNDLVIMVSGAGEVGKSTMIATLTSTTDTRKEDPERTKGIQITTHQVKDGPVLHFKDMAGQEDFCVTHDIFSLSSAVPSIGLITVRGTMDIEDIKYSMKKTAGRFLSRRKAPVVSGKQVSSLFTVLVVVTHLDKIKEEKLDAISDAYQVVCNEFRKKLSFKRFLPLNAKEKDERFAAFEKELISICMEELKKAPKQPKILSQATEVLSSLQKDVGKPYSSKDMFTNSLCAALNLTKLSNPETIDKQVTSFTKVLTAYGMIVSFNAAQLKDLIVNRPGWLLEHAVGVVFSPGNFKGVIVKFINGAAPLEDVIRTLNECKEAEGEGLMILRMVIQLGVALQVGEELLAPHKLPLSSCRLGTMLKEDAEDTAKIFYAGMEFVCEDAPGFSPAMVVRVQTQLYAYFNDANHPFSNLDNNPVCKLHKNLVEITTGDSSALGCVSFCESMLRAVAVVRADEADRFDAFCLLNILQLVFFDMNEQHSPGTSFQMKAVSPSSIRNQLSTASKGFSFVSYDTDRVRRNFSNGRPLRTGAFRDEPSDFLCLPENHASLLPDSVVEQLDSALDQDHLVRLASLLKRPRARASVDDSTTVTSLIRTWSFADAQNNTTTKLFEVLAKSDEDGTYGDVCSILEDHEERVS
eukprot:scpid24158/ scgid5754/ Ankyrin repeat domain-containing protein 23; Diabetes-related ankyrin repeat protein